MHSGLFLHHLSNGLCTVSSLLSPRDVSKECIHCGKVKLSTGAGRSHTAVTIQNGLRNDEEHTFLVLVSCSPVIYSLKIVSTHCSKRLNYIDVPYQLSKERAL